MNVYDVIDKIDNRIEQLENARYPYIQCEDTKLFFKPFSSHTDINIFQDIENNFQIKYYSHNSEYRDFKHNKVDDVLKDAEFLCEDIMDYCSYLENNQIIKEVVLKFSYEKNNDFLNDDLFNNLIDKYIYNKLSLKYENFIIKNKIFQKNSIVKLYQIEIEVENKIFYEYFLFYNAFCIDFTLNSYCNSTMSRIISEMLMSCSFSESYSDDSYLGISKEELDIAFEINEK